jgi:uncharacterized protein YbjT (DUF2867 family)
MPRSDAGGEASRDTILLTGGTGYVGGRLLQRLQRERRRVRCLSARPDSLARQAAPTTDVVAVDVLRPAAWPA